MRTRGLRVNSIRIIHETIEGEAVMIDLVSGNYYTLGEVGTEHLADVTVEQRSLDGEEHGIEDDVLQRAPHPRW